MSKKRKISTATMPAIKVEVKEENIYGDDVLLARGRLKGALQDLIEQSGDESMSSEDDRRKNRYRSPSKKISKRRKSDSSPAAAYHHTYVMKLFDRSVDLARFEEDTPLYPICRAWMANQPRNPQVIIKRRASTPEMDYNRMPILWNGDRLREIYNLPPPKSTPISRIPDPIPEQMLQNKDDIHLDYDEEPPIPREELIKNHLRRWADVKRQWIDRANKNEERFQSSMGILTLIYNKAQESME